MASSAKGVTVMHRTSITLALAAFGIACSLFTAFALARDSHVNCNFKGDIGKIATVLSRLNPAETNTVHVSGYCRENLVISGFDRLSLIADPGAVIEDASGGKVAVIEIIDSRDVVVQGFTIRGGLYGLFCRDFSLCRFVGDTVKQTAANAGIFFAKLRGEGDRHHRPRYRRLGDHTFRCQGWNYQRLHQQR
jgi:hypothetical protein